MSTEKTYTGRCFCGAVELRVTGKPAAMGYCHCTSCREWSAGPINAFTLWPIGAVTITKGADQVGSYTKTPRRNRKWCKICGGHILTEHPHWELIDVYASVIPDFRFEPALHVNYGETLLHLHDGLPKQKDLPSEMGGTGTVIAGYSARERAFPISIRRKTTRAPDRVDANARTPPREARCKRAIRERRASPPADRRLAPRGAGPVGAGRPPRVGRARRPSRAGPSLQPGGGHPDTEHDGTGVAIHSVRPAGGPLPEATEPEHVSPQREHVTQVQVGRGLGGELRHAKG